MKVKYIIKNGLDNIERFFRRNTFRLFHGYNYEDCWNLDWSMAKWLVPRLKHLRDNGAGYPGSLIPEEWEIILNKMIAAFELIVEDDHFCEPEKEAIIDEGLDLFREYYQALWD